MKKVIIISNKIMKKQNEDEEKIIGRIKRRLRKK